MDLEQLARVYSFATIRKAKAKAKTQRALQFLTKLENYKLNGAGHNEYRKVGFK